LLTLFKKMEPIIEVEHLSKKYKYNEFQPYYTLRDTLAGIIKVPFQLFKKTKKQNTLKKGEFWALKDLSFKVNPGEAIGIIGPNGAGKSTLLKVLSRITPPTSGEAILRGRVGSLLEVGTGFQQELTGRENVYLNGAILGMKRREIDKKFDEIVEFSEM
jgi:lipopolysaccharide transport system ATP-binding protein